MVAPFVYITLPPPPSPAGEGEDGGGAAAEVEAEAEVVALQCFSRFVRVFLRNMYTDEEFKAMQCAFGLFRLLLLYHSPLLSARLDRAGFPPELYLVRGKSKRASERARVDGLASPRPSHSRIMSTNAHKQTPWLLTVFSRTLDMDTTLQLWDQYILVRAFIHARLIQKHSHTLTRSLHMYAHSQEDDPLLHVFVVLAFLRRHEAALLACGEDTLPETISTLRFTGNVEVGVGLGWLGLEGRRMVDSCLTRSLPWPSF